MTAPLTQSHSESRRRGETGNQDEAGETGNECFRPDQAFRRKCSSKNSIGFEISTIQTQPRRKKWQIQLTQSRKQINKKNLEAEET